MKSFLLKRKKDQTLPPLKGGTKGGLKNEILTKKIIFNLTIASAYYLLFTFIFDFDIINAILEDTKNYFFSILISSFLLFFIPVFYASQTIPLLSEILE
jgi:hypothetical protein